MDKLITFDGKVAIVTGAGRGIGRAYAELLAARGARVIVNDIGGTMTGDGHDDRTAADDAAHAITVTGGSAEPDTSDIATELGAQSLIDHAVDSYGRVDIVVNNAGIYTMDSFPDLELAVLRRHFDVHVGGSFNVTRAAWPHLAAAKSGRVVLTTSTGALGAANMVAYGQAKGAVLALGRSLAQVGIRVGIKVNNVAPLAMTRMMRAGAGLEGEFPPDPAQSPVLVAPLVAVLCHERCPTTGETYVSGMRRASRLFVCENEGYTHPGVALTPEDVLERWAEVRSDERYSALASTGEEVAFMSQFVEAVEVLGEGLHE